jgi:hypothetical protein
MKTIVVFVALTFLFATVQSFAQDVPQSQVPSLVLNSFQQAFPKASDVDWEMDGDKYKVDFEIGLKGVDHEVWYDQGGKLLKHTEEISKADLPEAVRAKIEADYGSYRIDDVRKITEGSGSIYSLEAKKGNEEWKITFDSAGKELSKIAD